MWIDCFSLLWGLVHTFVVEGWSRWRQFFLEGGWSLLFVICYLTVILEYLSGSTSPILRLWNCGYGLYVTPRTSPQQFLFHYGILCWHDWPWKNIHCCVYRCLPLLHRPTVYLRLTKVSGDITIRNCRTAEPSMQCGIKSCIKTMMA